MRQNGPKYQHFSQICWKMTPYAAEKIHYNLNYAAVTPSINSKLTSILKTVNTLSENVHLLKVVTTTMWYSPAQQ